MSFLLGRLQFVIGQLQDLFSGIIERQGNPELTNALTGVVLGVATAGASFLGKNYMSFPKREYRSRSLRSSTKYN